MDTPREIPNVLSDPHAPLRRLVYAGPRFEVHSVELPGRGGRTVRRDAVVTPDAVVILPITDDGRVVMIRNERFVVNETLWELPAGTFEKGEEPIACAARELVEETGYRAGQVEPLTSFFPSPGMATERMHAFVATGLTHVGQDLDENERITVDIRPMEQVLEMIRSGTIHDGKTIATVLYYATWGEGR